MIHTQFTFSKSRSVIMPQGQHSFFVVDPITPLGPCGFRRNNVGNATKHPYDYMGNAYKKSRFMGAPTVATDCVVQRLSCSFRNSGLHSSLPYHIMPSRRMSYPTASSSRPSSCLPRRRTVNAGPISAFNEVNSRTWRGAVNGIRDRGIPCPPRVCNVG